MRIPSYVYLPLLDKGGVRFSPSALFAFYEPLTPLTHGESSLPVKNLQKTQTLTSLGAGHWLVALNNPF